MNVRRRVLFVCIGNSCRSQMAEAFARRYGSDVIEAESAGLSPCKMVAPVTTEVMLEKGIDLDGCHPKGLAQTGGSFDLIVNMSGLLLPDLGAPVRDWEVEDPIWVSRERHREIRDEIEMRVQKLILEFRRRDGSPGL
ncbi:MAG: arsenate reductase ArsC [Rhodospirillales bacterium]